MNLGIDMKTLTKPTAAAVVVVGQDAIQDAAERLAMSKISAGDARDIVKPGTYDIDTTVNIKGTITVGEDYETTPTANIPILPVMALLVQRMGFQREKAMKIIVDAINESIADKDTTVLENLQKDTAEIEAAIEVVRKGIISKLAKVKANGKVTHKLKTTQIKQVTVK
jgi:hypothetical protein